MLRCIQIQSYALFSFKALQAILFCARFRYSTKTPFKMVKEKPAELAYRAQSGFCSKYATFQVDSCWTDETAVSTSCAVVRMKFAQLLHFVFFNCLLDQDGTQFVAANAHARTAPQAVCDLDGFELFSFRKFRFLQFCCGTQFPDLV